MRTVIRGRCLLWAGKYACKIIVAKPLRGFQRGLPGEMMMQSKFARIWPAPLLNLRLARPGAGLRRGMRRCPLPDALRQGA